MPKFCVYAGGRQLSVEEGTLLSEVLADIGLYRSFDCGGMGSCGKCTVLVDGEPKLSCQYRIYSDVTVTLPENKDSKSGISLSASTNCGHKGSFFLLDIGTTTLNLKLVGSDGRVFGSAAALNPQRRYGSDVMSRISYCSENGIAACRAILLESVLKMMAEISDPAPRKLLVGGNTAMLHIFAGEDVSGLGTYPYTPVFLEGRNLKIAELEAFGIENIELLPSLSAFVGADAVAGIAACGLPGDNAQKNLSDNLQPGGNLPGAESVNIVPKLINGGNLPGTEAASEKYKILLDLGTNAEILLFSKDKLLATSAAAGPCFEGAGISCGMPALPGAISSFSLDNGKRLYSVIGGKKPVGICGTGLFDIIAALLDAKMITEDGKLLCDNFEICDASAASGLFAGLRDSFAGRSFEAAAGKASIYITQSDVRNFQLAKAAVAAGIALLIDAAGIDYSCVCELVISGGFSSKLNVRSAVRCGLIPQALAKRSRSISNSCLGGLSAYLRGDRRFLSLLETAVSLDLSLSPSFQSCFLSNLNF